MSGIAIDVVTRADKANTDLQRINTNLRSMAENAKQSASALNNKFKFPSLSKLLSENERLEKSLQSVGKTGSTA